MILPLKECSKDIQEIIKKQAELENIRTGYDMELEPAVSLIDRCYYYHMVKKLHYEDYTVEIRNQGDYEVDEKLLIPKDLYAYKIEISSKEPNEPDMTYRLSELMTDLGRYGELPSWKTLKSFFESDAIKQLFMKHREIYEQLVMMIQEDMEGEV